MTASESWIGDASLRWIQQLLAERFGNPLVLQLANGQSIRLRLQGAAPAIELVTAPHIFARLGSDLPCGSWSAASEGWVEPLAKELPAPGARSLTGPLIEETDFGYRIHYDILGLAYWILSRQEEVGRTDLDNHGRFPATSSHAFKHGYLERPIVDEWLHVLGQVMQRLWPGFVSRKTQFTMKLSHDVDAPSPYGFCSGPRLVRYMAGDVLKRGNVKGAVLAPWVRLNTRSRLHRADPANTFDWIMSESDRHGLRSAFYFICGRTDAKKDADYEPEHPAIRDLIGRIHARGHEIGLHPSYNTCNEPGLITGEARRLRRVCAEEGIDQPEWGGRMHFLRWSHPVTMRGWEEAGMTYDSSLGYADRPGFRCGTCFEYPAFDPVQRQALKLRIRPLIAMECTVMAERYMGLGTSPDAFDVFSRLKQACRAVNGDFTLLWHNTQLTTLRERELYRAVVEN